MIWWVQAKSEPMRLALAERAFERSEHRTTTSTSKEPSQLHYAYEANFEFIHDTRTIATALAIRIRSPSFFGSVPVRPIRSKEPNRASESSRAERAMRGTRIRFRETMGCCSSSDASHHPAPAAPVVLPPGRHGQALILGFTYPSHPVIPPLSSVSEEIR